MPLGRWAAGRLGRTVYARTIADCVCIDNRNVHEWLIRDQSAIARQLGLDKRSLAQRWLNQSAGQIPPAMPPAPAPYRSYIDPGSLAQGYAGAFGQLWGAGFGAAQACYDQRVISALPGRQTACGRAVLGEFWHSLRAGLPGAAFSVEHLVANARKGRATAIAKRWRVRAVPRRRPDQRPAGRCRPAYPLDGASQHCAVAVQFGVRSQYS